MTSLNALLDRICSGAAPSADEALSLSSCDDLPALMRAAARLRDMGHGPLVSYSRKVFIPLTKLCRDSCHYCTFARPPGRTVSADKPELRYAAAREALERLGHPTTLSYLAAMATSRRSSSRTSVPSRGRAWPMPAPSADDHLWTIAVARLIFGPEMNLQAPPNLSGGPLGDMIAAGINDWGGVSPVTPDHVNPEAPWPALEALRRRTEEAGKALVERLAIYPAYARTADVARTLRYLQTAMAKHRGDPYPRAPP